MEINSDQISEIYKEVYHMIMERDFQSIDKKYQEFNVKELNMVLLVGLPRLTYLYRDEMDEWDSFLERCKNEIDERGENSEELLKGLL
jgi:hypothetical protein